MYSMFMAFLCTDVLANLKYLKTLDLSHNDLTSIPTDHVFFPGNLSNLFIHNNKLQHFSSHVFENLTTVKFIDIQNNSLELFDLDLLNSIKTGLVLIIAGNFYMLW